MHFGAVLNDVLVQQHISKIYNILYTSAIFVIDAVSCPFESSMLLQHWSYKICIAGSHLIVCLNMPKEKAPKMPSLPLPRNS